MIKEIIKAPILILLGILLVVSISGMIASQTASHTLEYNTIKPIFQETVREALNSQIASQMPFLKTDTIYEAMKLECLVKKNISFPTGIEQVGNITLTCTEIKNASNFNNTLNLIVAKSFDKLYYTHAKKSFISAVSSNPYLLISDDARNYFSKTAFTLLLAVIIILIIQFFLHEKKPRFLITTGITILFSYLPIYILTKFLTYIPIKYLNRFFTELQHQTRASLIPIIIWAVIFAVAGIIWMIVHSKFIEKKKD